MNYEMPFFGEFDLNKLSDYYETEIEFEGRMTRIDLNFEDPKISIEKLNLIKNQLNRLDSLHQDNKNDIKADYQAGKEVAFYINDYLENLEEEDLNEILRNADKAKSRKKQMLETLYLARIGFYPETIDSEIVCDYTLSETHVDGLVVVFRALNGTFDGISIES